MRGAPAGPRDERTDGVNRWPGKVGGPVRYRAASARAAWSGERCAHGGGRRGRASATRPRWVSRWIVAPWGRVRAETVCGPDGDVVISIMLPRVPQRPG